MIAKALAVDLKEAKRIAHLSATWATERESLDRFHDTAEAPALGWASQAA